MEADAGVHITAFGFFEPANLRFPADVSITSAAVGTPYYGYTAMNFRTLCRSFLAAILIVLFGAASLPAQDRCPVLRVDDGVAATISKTLQPDAVLCYRLETTPGQKISLKVVRGDNTIFSVEGLTDAQDKFTFTAQASSYALTVAQLMRTVRSQAFQIEVTASKQDAGAAPSSSGPAPQMRYQDLPENIRRPVDDVRTQCREFGPNAVPKDEMAGIVPVYLEGKRAVVLDFRTVCTDLYTGANCTNHGCDMRVWVEQDAVWRETFNELLVAPTLSGGADATLFEITGNLWAGDPRCGKSRRERPMARESCAVEFSYRKGVWTSRRKTADRLPR